MHMIGRIRRLHVRDKLSEREIARMTGLSRNTLSKWLRAAVAEAPKYRREARPNKLSAFEATLKQALTADARRPKHERRTTRALHAEIKAAGYGGGYSAVTDFVRAWRQREGQAVNVTAFVPLNFELGEAFQFDWSEEGLVVGGIYYRMQVSHLKLCASGAFWLVAYPSQGHEMLFDAHKRSFAALGGVDRRGIYDNMRTAADKVHKGKGRTVNARFSVMCATCTTLTSATSPPAGRRGAWRRTCRTAAGASGSRQPGFASAPSSNSTPGWASAVERDPASRAQPIQRGGDARARASPPDAHAGALRWLRGEAGARVEHLLGVGGTQPLLGALRAGGADGQHKVLSGRRRGRRR